MSTKAVGAHSTGNLAVMLCAMGKVHGAQSGVVRDDQGGRHGRYNTVG